MSISLDAKAFSESQIEKGQIVFSKGDKAENIYILNNGQVACFLVSKDKRIIPVYSLKNSGIFGEDGVLSKSGFYQYFAVALEDSTVTKIPDSDVSTFMKEAANWIPNILNNISDRIHNTIEVISEHKIIDDRLNGGEEFSQEEEKLILKSLTN